MRTRCAALALTMVIPFRVDRLDQGPGLAPVAAPLKSPIATSLEITDTALRGAPALGA